jgi:hypothetical protein
LFGVSSRQLPGNLRICDRDDVELIDGRVIVGVEHLPGRVEIGDQQPVSVELADARNGEVRPGGMARGEIRKRDEFHVVGVLRDGGRADKGGVKLEIEQLSPPGGFPDDVLEGVVGKRAEDRCAREILLDRLEKRAHPIGINSRDRRPGAKCEPAGAKPKLCHGDQKVVELRKK